MRRLLLSLFTLALATGCASRQENDTDKLQGSWQAVAIDQTDLQLPPEGEKTLRTLKIHFSGDKVTVEANGKNVQNATYFLNTEKFPREITFKPGESKHARPDIGIYKLEGNQFTLAGGNDTVTPTAFKSSKAPFALCITFEKIPEPAGK